MAVQEVEELDGMGLGGGRDVMRMGWAEWKNGGGHVNIASPGLPRITTRVQLRKHDTNTKLGLDFQVALSTSDGWVHSIF